MVGGCLPFAQVSSRLPTGADEDIVKKNKNMTLAEIWANIKKGGVQYVGHPENHPQDLTRAMRWIQRYTSLKRQLLQSVDLGQKAL